MRPDSLNPLFAAASSLAGIGPKLERTLAKLFGRGTEDGARVADLVWHLPSGLINRGLRPPLSEAPEGRIVTLELTVDAHDAPPRGARRPYRVICHDASGEITLVFFHAHRDYLTKILPPGARRFVSGRIERFSGALQMAHPDHILTEDEFAAMPPVEPVYPLTAGLSAKVLRRAIEQAVQRCPELAEWQDQAWLERQAWPSFSTAVQAVHAPQRDEDLEPQAPARARLAYDELLANQLALALVRARMRKVKGRAIKGDGEVRRRVRDALPFSLTPSQETAISEIIAELAEPTRMARLLQGDVGSGKTVVALLAMAAAIEAGHQAALMAPTEVLARQHLATLEPLCRQAGITISLLTGREKGAARKTLLEGLASGETDIAVGTHALFQEGVEFRDLALAVVDEQHRFGVHQRMALQAKGADTVDLLVMTATPIPRTLTLILYGDMESSNLTEKPAGRRPIETAVVPLQRLDDVVARLGAALEGGAKVYWICPLVEESEVIDAAAAEDRAKWLEAHFPGRVGLVHGRMKGADKDRAMAEFRSGPSDILVATTVVEVGVDVSDATVMIIEHAERFGLAQMHQLRGRVGRSDRPSTCLLLYQSPLGETAEARLKIMRETEDGFRIAEEDLRLRGGGELLGARQSGFPEFRLADLGAHGDLLAAARDDARLVLANDGDLTGPRGEALRTLLYLFEHDRSVRLLGAG